MIRIFKYPINNQAVTTITCRRKRFLDIQSQNGNLVCWIEIDDDSPEIMTTLVQIGTGWEIPSEFMNGAKYLKTIQDNFGYVWHFYEVLGGAEPQSCGGAL